MERMKGKLIIQEEIEVSDLETAKRILEIIDDLSREAFDEFSELIIRFIGTEKLMGIGIEKIQDEEKIKQSQLVEEMIEQLRFGGLLKKGRLELTEKGKQWLCKKITEIK